MATQRVKLIYPDDLVRRPVLSEVAIEFRVMSNIRRAAVDEDNGWIICELEGELVSISKAIEWMKSLGVDVEMVNDVVES